MITPDSPVEFITKAEYLAHLLALDQESRRWRFGYSANDFSIEKYVNDSGDRDIFIGIRETAPGREIISAMHLSMSDETRSAEMGISTVQTHRRQGHAERVLKFAMVVLRNRGVFQLYTTCLSDNQPLLGLFKKLGVTSISHEPGGREARVSLPLTGPDSIMGELNNGTLVVMDHAMRPFQSLWKRMFGF